MTDETRPTPQPAESGGGSYEGGEEEARKLAAGEDTNALPPRPDEEVDERAARTFEEGTYS